MAKRFLSSESSNYSKYKCKTPQIGRDIGKLEKLTADIKMPGDLTTFGDLDQEKHK